MSQGIIWWISLFVVTNLWCVRATALSKDMYVDLKKRERVRYALGLNISVSVGFYRSGEFYFCRKINLREGRTRDIISSGGKKWPSNGAVNAPFGQNKCCVRLVVEIDRALFSGRIFLPSLYTWLTSNRCLEDMFSKVVRINSEVYIKKPYYFLLDSTGFFFAINYLNDNGRRCRNRKNFDEISE